MNNESPVVFHPKGDDEWLKEALTPVKFDPKKKDAEHRKYLVLCYFTEQQAEEVGYDGTFIVATGRTDTYFAIKAIVDIIDLKESVVMLEGNKALVDQITVLQFLRHIIDDELVEDEGQYVVAEAVDEYDEEAVEDED